MKAWNEKKLRRYFEGTVWCVPPETVTGYIYSASNPPQKADIQNLWLFERVEGYYVFGTVYTMLNGSPNGKASLIMDVGYDNQV